MRVVPAVIVVLIAAACAVSTGKAGGRTGIGRGLCPVRTIEIAFNARRITVTDSRRRMLAYVTLAGVGLGKPCKTVETLSTNISRAGPPELQETQEPTHLSCTFSRRVEIQVIPRFPTGGVVLVTVGHTARAALAAAIGRRGTGMIWKTRYCH